MKSVLPLVVGLVLSAVSAQADVVYEFSYHGPGVSASGTITVQPYLNPGEWLLTGISGTRNSSAITGGTYGLQSSPLADGTPLDNIIYFATPAPTSTATFTVSNGGNPAGFAFQTADGIFQPYSWQGGVYPGTSGPNYPAGVYEFQEGTWPDPFVNVPITFTVSTPEPGFYGTFGALAVGLLGLVAVIRRRKIA